MALNIQQTYQQNQINTAAPHDLVLLLYNGGIKFLNLAKSLIQQKKYDEASQYCYRVQDILTELIVGLDRKIEISNNFFALYEFMKYHLMQANIKKDTKMFDEVIGFFEELRNTWKQAIELAKKQGS